MCEFDRKVRPGIVAVWLVEVLYKQCTVYRIYVERNPPELLRNIVCEEAFVLAGSFIYHCVLAERPLPQRLNHVSDRSQNVSLCRK